MGQSRDEAAIAFYVARGDSKHEAREKVARIRLMEKALARAWRPVTKRSKAPFDDPPEYHESFV